MVAGADPADSDKTAVNRERALFWAGFAIATAGAIFAALHVLGAL